jgi:hypothetical protein
MKTLILNYLFDKTDKKITFPDYPSIRLDSILLITNVTYQNIIIYNFADSTKGGSVTNNILTLTYDTSSMANTDKLQIFYDDPDAITYTDFAVMLKQLLNVIANPPTTDKSLNKVRVDVSGQSVVVSSATLAANQDIRTVATVTNLSQIDTYPAKLAVVGINTSAWASSVRNLLT